MTETRWLAAKQHTWIDRYVFVRKSKLLKARTEGYTQACLDIAERLPTADHIIAGSQIFEPMTVTGEATIFGCTFHGMGDGSALTITEA